MEAKVGIDVSKLFNALREIHQIRSDKALAGQLGVVPCVISKARSEDKIGSSLIVRISDRFDLTAKQIRQLGA